MGVNCPWRGALPSGSPVELVIYNEGSQKAS